MAPLPLPTSLCFSTKGTGLDASVLVSVPILPSTGREEDTPHKGPSTKKKKKKNVCDAALFFFFFFCVVVVVFPSF